MSGVAALASLGGGAAQTFYSFVSCDSCDSCAAASGGCTSTVLYMRARRACAQNAQNVHGSRVLFFISSAVSTVPRWHQLCPGQQAPACHRPQADHHLAQLRLVRLLEELPDELSSSVEAALAKIVHLLSIFLLHRVVTTDSNLVFRSSNPV